MTMAADFLGQGWRFPIQLEGGHVARSSGDDGVEESIWLILGTAPGERVMRPDFGCGIHDLVFSVGSASTAGRVAQEVRDALQRWEGRIDVLSVQAAPDETVPQMLVVSIDYRVRATNRVGNLVYPFYLDGEGA